MRNFQTRSRVSWKALVSASGYNLKWSYNKNMRGSKNIELSRWHNDSRRLKRLKPKKYVYVQVQAYIKDGDTLVTGPWSKVVRSRVKIK